MDLSLTVQELRDLLTPPLLRLKTPAELNLDAMPNALPGDLVGATPNDFVRELRERLRSADAAEDMVAQGARAAEDLMLADLRQTKEELNRASVMLEERRSELEQLVDAINKLKARPAWQAEQVIARAGAQVLDVCRMFFLESASDSWYEGMRTGLRDLTSTLGVEVDDVQIEEHLKPREPELEPPAAPAILLTDADAPAQRATYHATLGPVAEDLVAPEIGELEAPFVLEPKEAVPPAGSEDTSAEVAALADRTSEEFF